MSKKRKQRNRKNIRSYKTYIDSSLWTNRKNRYWKKHRKICRACKCTKYIQLHHVIYNKKQFGKEPDTDFQVLCRECHYLFHDIFGSSKDMRSDTLFFIKERKSFMEGRYEFCSFIEPIRREEKVKEKKIKKKAKVRIKSREKRIKKVFNQESYWSSRSRKYEVKQKKERIHSLRRMVRNGSITEKEFKEKMNLYTPTP